MKLISNALHFVACGILYASNPQPPSWHLRGIGEHYVVIRSAVNGDLLTEQQDGCSSLHANKIRVDKRSTVIIFCYTENCSEISLETSKNHWAHQYKSYAGFRTSNSKENSKFVLEFHANNRYAFRTENFVEYMSAKEESGSISETGCIIAAPFSKSSIFTIEPIPWERYGPSERQPTWKLRSIFTKPSHYLSSASPKQQFSTELLIRGNLFSNNGSFELLMQPDGNLVLYRTYAAHSSCLIQGCMEYEWWCVAFWSTHTKTGKRAVMKNDGNFVVYDEHNQEVWSSYTPGHPGTILKLLDDGRLIIYDPVTSIEFWSTPPPPPPRMFSDGPDSGCC